MIDASEFLKEIMKNQPYLYQSNNVRVLREIGDIAYGYGGWILRFTYAEYNNECKYDLRYWEPENTNCSHGIRMRKDAPERFFYYVDREIKNYGKQMSFEPAMHTSGKIRVLREIADIAHGDGDYILKFTYASCDGENKYDLRYWNDNNLCSKGIRFRKNDLDELWYLIKKELNNVN